MNRISRGSLSLQSNSVGLFWRVAFSFINSNSYSAATACISILTEIILILVSFI